MHWVPLHTVAMLHCTMWLCITLHWYEIYCTNWTRLHRAALPHELKYYQHFHLSKLISFIPEDYKSLVLCINFILCETKTFAFKKLNFCSFAFLHIHSLNTFGFCATAHGRHRISQPARRVVHISNLLYIEVQHSAVECPELLCICTFIHI